MAAEVYTLTAITMPGLSSEWLVPASQQIVTEFGTFVRIDPKNSSLKKLVHENNDSVEDNKQTLTAMVGYSKLREGRSEALTAAAKKSKQTTRSTCTLFAEEEAAHESGAEDVSSITVPSQVEYSVGTSDGERKVIALGTYKVKSCVYVKLGPNSIFNAIKILRDCGSGGRCYKERDPNLPPGVWKRDGHYIVHTPDKKYKRATTIEGAQVLLLDESPTSSVGVDGGGEPCEPMALWAPQAADEEGM